MSTDQSINIYQKLIDAKNNDASHGVDTEIYIYELMPYYPNYAANWNDASENQMIDFKEYEKDAFQTLLTIIKKFRERYSEKEYQIQINMMTISDAWNFYYNSENRFCHRCKVSVVQN